jgi:hypothetical protein
LISRWMVFGAIGLPSATWPRRNDAGAA